LLSEVLLINLAIVHCGWLSQITRSACQLTTVASTVNALSCTKNIKKLSMNKSDKTCCLRSLHHSGVISNVTWLFISGNVGFFRTAIFERANITRWSHKKFCNFAVIEGNQMPLGIFMYV